MSSYPVITRPLQPLCVELSFTPSASPLRLGTTMPSPSIIITSFLTVALLATTLIVHSHSKWYPYPNYVSCISEALFGPHHILASVTTNDGAEKKRDCKKEGKKVPLEIHIMSQCPDAKDCLEMMVAPAMEKVSDIVDFKINFIGKQTQDGSISCMHGPSECLSNTIHLCASHLYPHTYLPFSLCLIHNYTLLPQRSFIESCVSQHNVSFDKINACVSSLEPDGGLELLKESVQRSHDVGAEVSCTVRVDEKVWCIRDGRKWKDCEGGTEAGDLVGRVKYLYTKHESEEAGGGVEENDRKGDIEKTIMKVKGKGLAKQSNEGLRQLFGEKQIVWRG